MHAIALAIAMVLAPAGAAHAGEVRVTVGGALNAFTPRAVNCNVGDVVTWVWGGSSHSVTSGDSSTVVPDGTFNSGILSYNPTNGTAFSWKATGAGTFRYFCEPHAPVMAGRVIVSGSGILVADFRITEAQFNVAGGLDLIEVANLGRVNGNLGRYRVSVGTVIGGGPPTTAVAVIPRDTLTVAPGARVVIHTGASGTNTQTDLFMGSVLGDLPANGSAALYAPNTAAPSLSDATQILDFVEWGAVGQPNEATAASALVWTAGEALLNVADGHSIEFCGASGEYGKAHWAEISAPNFGTDGGCTTPALRTTWGRVKTLYR